MIADCFDPACSSVSLNCEIPHTKNAIDCATTAKTETPENKKDDNYGNDES